MRRWLFSVLMAGVFAVASAPAAQADVRVEIDRSTQTMNVSLDGQHLYSWQVSTGRPGWSTPPGVFHPQFMAARWFSHIFNNAPMPYSIFYRGSFAIHGTADIARLGSPASHGCIRLHPNDAAVLFDLVQKQGMRNTTIVVQ
jgi:lipoprotein-anchoring transpeptidase ErfK/SrfK